LNEEIQTVVKMEVGYTWSISIEREIRTPTGAKYPDKTVVKAALTGHARTYEGAVTSLKQAKLELEKVVNV